MSPISTFLNGPGYSNPLTPRVATLETAVADLDATVAALGVAALREIVVPFAWDDPDILTGKHIYTPTPGERLMAGSTFYFTTEFNFDTDFGFEAWVGFEDFPTVSDSLATLIPDESNHPVDTGHHLVENEGDMLTNGLTTIMFVDSTPLILAIDNAFDGGDPHSTQGEGEVRLLILPKGT